MDEYSLVRLFFKGILNVGFGFTITGADHVPATGPVILPANHGSQIDPVIVAAAVPRRCTFLAAAELLEMPVLGTLIRPFRAIPVKRGRSDRRAIAECLARLQRGEALVIFPEGKISTDGTLQPAHDGLAFMASKARVPIVPIGIAGTHKVWPIGTRIPRRGKITVRIGEAIVPAWAPTREGQSALTSRVMDAIALLSCGAIAPSKTPKLTGLRAAG
jgi:1-acyl-sn-glycerol-3-phosphate acyltransferase